MALKWIKVLSDVLRREKREGNVFYHAIILNISEYSSIVSILKCASLTL